MAGTPKNYDVTHIHQGPGDLWIIGGGAPADSATPQLTLAVDGTPDATAHPSSIHLGLTDSAITMTITPKIEDIMADQADGPVDRFLTNISEMAIEAELQQLDPTIMQNAIPFGVYSTAGGYKQLTFGGQPIPVAASAPCVALIAPKRAVAGKYIVTVLFKATGMVGLSTTIGRAKKAIYKSQWKGLTDLTRAAGRQIGVMYETL